MTAQAGWTCKVGLSGTSTAFTNEACTQLVAGTSYQITNAVKRVVDPATAFTVKDNGVDKTAFATLDFLHGVITFSGYSATGPVTITGAYLPIVTLALARTFAINRSWDLKDITTFANSVAGERTWLPTLQSGDGELESLEPTDLNEGAGVGTLQSLLDAGTAKLLEVNMGNGYFFRAWVLLESQERKNDVSDVMKNAVKWKTAALTAANGVTKVYQSVGT